MDTRSDSEFSLKGWGSDKKLIEGLCGHCYYAVQFKEAEKHTSLTYSELFDIDEDWNERRDHYFIMGICPRPNCRRATVVYREEKTDIHRGDSLETEVVQERVVFPATSNRIDLPEEVPTTLRECYREAASIEHLSPNGSAFLARRILEQALRDCLEKPKAKLHELINVFLETKAPPGELHDVMQDIREFGNIAGHPAQDQQGDWTSIDPAEASYTLDVAAEVLDYIYVRPNRRKTMRERWQSKKRGETLTLQPSSQIVVGDREDEPATPSSDEEDIPF